MKNLHHAEIRSIKIYTKCTKNKKTEENQFQIPRIFLAKFSHYFQFQRSIKICQTY